MKLYIGENLKKLRNEKNIKQEELAEYLGISYQAVSRWENGLSYPDIEFLPELSRFFEVSLEELLGTESDEKKINETINECYWLNETDKPAALAKLRALEREYPTKWAIKQAICEILVHPEPASYNEVLPELRKYAEEALRKCSVKDGTNFQRIVGSLIQALPEEEVDEWIKYMNYSHEPTRFTALAKRYRIRNDSEKAKHYRSRAIVSCMTQLEIQYLEYDKNAGIEERIAWREQLCAVENALIGEPYRKDGRVHNSSYLWNRAVCRTYIAEAYAECGQTERGLAELEKAVDLWLIQADSMKDPYFTSDSPLLEDVENRWVNKFQGVEYGIDALTDTSDWKGFDSIRQDARFTAQLERLKAKKEELEIYFRQRASE